MKCKWQTKHISDIAYTNPKESLPKKSYAKKIAMEKLQPFCRDISSYDFCEFNGGTKFRNGDTIMARITPCLENGKIAQVNILEDGEVGFGSTEYIVFRAREGNTEPNFLYYLISSSLVREPAIKSMVGSSGRQRVQIDVVSDIEIEIPPFSEQKKIAHILSILDDKIATNTAINKNLESQAQAIFKSWFVDFEPFGGEMPRDWRIGNAGEILEFHDAKRVPLSGSEREKMDKIYPYYGATSLMDYVDNYIFEGIFLLLGEDGTVITKEGFPVLQYIDGKFWVNNHAHILTGKLGFSVEELYLLFSITNIKSIVTGAVQPKVSQTNLKKLSVVIPSTYILKEFDGVVQPLFEDIRFRRVENERLTVIRDTLLPRLMSGEIDVGNIEV